MRTIRVEKLLHAPAERVFDVLADHEGYVRFPGVKSATLTRTGTAERNGVGAVRQIDLGAARFEEEIVAFERPNLLEYRIIRSRPPIEHELGRLRFTPRPDGVEVIWTSTFRVKVPVIGGLLTLVAVRTMASAFDRVLATTEKLAR
jgi:uncharacterized protein YndB with AHSA1/START domain